MRLIHTKTYRLKEYTGYGIPPYAILSHTWGNDEDEVTYKDVAADSQQPSEEQNNPGVLAELQKPGAVKIRECCEIVRQDGLQWLWVDTCCIDKSSSAELTEAINSMYAYYQRSARCYVYLSDLSTVNHNFSSSKIRLSRWFTRGWTLQELLGPQVVIFCSSEWAKLGVKGGVADSAGFVHLLADVTKIDVGVLDGSRNLHTVSIAERMSWAAPRETKRIEDRAYSLMGIFNVNMPTMYGEGERAFLRLQEEIMKDSDDHSLFAWRNASDPDLDRGLLAASPGDFAESGDVAVPRIAEYLEVSEPYSKTNKGLSICLRLRDIGENIYLAFLNCGQLSSGRRMAIYLRRLGLSNQYVRIYANTLISVPMCDIPPYSSSLYVRQAVPVFVYKNLVLQYSPSQTPDHILTRVSRGESARSESMTQGAVKIECPVLFNFSHDFSRENHFSSRSSIAELEFTSKLEALHNVIVRIEPCSRSRIGFRVGKSRKGTDSHYNPAQNAVMCIDHENRHSFDPSGRPIVLHGLRIILGLHHDPEKEAAPQMQIETGKSYLLHLEIRRIGVMEYQRDTSQKQ